jgi:hypothetical protein
MAEDFEQNKKDINDSTRSLDTFNDALKESINLSKQLSKLVETLPTSLRFSAAANNNLVKTTNEYRKALEDTDKISKKVAAGKAKEAEVQSHINDLQEKYKAYMYQNEASFKSTGRFLLKQKSLKDEIAQLEKDEIKRRGTIMDADLKIEAIQQQIAQQQQLAATVISQTGKKNATDRIKQLKEQLKDEYETINVSETLSKRNERIISQKVKEKQQVDGIITTHKNLVKQYDDELEKAIGLKKALAEQNSFAGALSKIFNNIKDKISSALKPLALMTVSFEFLKKMAFAVSDQVAKLQKNLVLSEDEARDLRQDFNNIAAASGDAAVNTARLVEANIELGKQLGFSSRFTADLNIQFVKLTKQIGLSEEAAGGLAKLSIATGRTLEESKNIALETSQSLSSQYGIQLNQREVLEEIGKISGQTLAMFKANPQALAQAVAQAKLLGTNLDIARKQASSLLNFESSIESELQAELLINQSLNLERARTAALTGDLTTVMKELNSQNIDFNKFSNMNVIAQNKVADALGLSSDELSDQLLKQQYLGKSQQEVAALAGDEVAKRLEALNAQDKFNLAMEKMQDAIGQIVGGPLGKLVDMMANLASSSAFVYGTLAAMAGLSLAKLISGLVSVAATLSTSAIASTTTATALTGGLAVAGIIAGIGTVAAALGAFTADAQDQAKQVGDMFSSNGKTIVSPKEGGLFELSDNDEFAAAPGIGDLLSRPNQSTVVAQDNSELIAKFDALLAKTEQTNSALNKLNSKEGNVYIGAQKVGTAQLMTNYNLA